MATTTVHVPNKKTTTTTPPTMKRADQRASITILVLGDEAVGKSSLISTFVSRYFSELVPGIMTRVRLPPDPEHASVTTIVDSQKGDAALLACLSSSSSSSSNMSLQQQQQQQSSAALAGSTVSGGGGGSSGAPGGGTLLLTPSASLQSLVGRVDSSPQQQQPTLSSSTTAGGAAAAAAAAAMTTSTTTTVPAGGVAAAATASSSSAGNLLYQSTSSSSSSAASAAAGISNVDSIILVYDLDRVETFFRLESHWLPLIERCYHGKVPVIVAENKMDLFHPSSTAGQADEQALARKRQQIVSLMQRFPFVRQCIKCSAKNLLRVDDVFHKAEQAVLYPFTPPLYDLQTGKLTAECKRAFTRIFRIYDMDHDGLLSDAELDRFQRETYHVAAFDRDFAAWKKVVTRHNPTADERVIEDGKFTIPGFLAIFDVFISQNRLDVVWQALRKFCYDDDLNLHVPESVIDLAGDDVGGGVGGGGGSSGGKGGGGGGGSGSSGSRNIWKISSSARRFLTAVFHQFDSDQDGVLSPDDIAAIFSILAPPALPPWHPRRAPDLFAGCLSLPKKRPSSTLMPSTSAASPPSDTTDEEESPASPSLLVPANMMAQALLSSSGISILSASDSIPSIDSAMAISKPLTYLEWMGHWHTISAISPAITRAELYRLGHIERTTSTSATEKRRRKKRAVAAVAPNTTATSTSTSDKKVTLVHDAKLRSREIRVLVLGSRYCGKTALLNALCYGGANGNLSSLTETSPTSRPETSSTFIKIRRKLTSTGSGSTSVSGKKSATGADEEGEELAVHLVFTDVPETAAASQEEHYRELSELFGSTAPRDRICDLAMLVFDANKPASLAYTKDLESTLLTKETPRVFVATKMDLFQQHHAASESPEELETDDDTVQVSTTVVDNANIHCQEMDLELPLLTCVVAADSDDDSGGAEDYSLATPESRAKALDHLARCALREPGVERLRSRPHEERKRREAARRRKMMWIGSIVTVSVVVVVGVGCLFLRGRSSSPSSSSASASSSGKKGAPSSGFGWLRSLFGGAHGGAGSETASTATRATS